MATKTPVVKTQKTTNFTTRLVKKIKRDIATSNFSESVDDTRLYMSDLIHRHSVNGNIGVIGINY